MAIMHLIDLCFDEDYGGRNGLLGLPSSFLLVSSFSLLAFLLPWKCFQILECVCGEGRESEREKGRTRVVFLGWKSCFFFKELFLALSCCLGRARLMGGGILLYFIFFLLVFLQKFKSCI